MIPKSGSSMLLRIVAGICLALAIGLPGVAATRAPVSPVQWQVVLAAGDNAQPVFDNAVIAFRDWLGSIGVPPGNIHRLSANAGQRDPGVEPANAEQLLLRIAALQPRPGEGCLVFITSHGQRGEGIFLAYSNEILGPHTLARALTAGCGDAPTVVIISGCYSGAFATAPMTARNRIVLTAARADRPSFGCQADRTYTVYDECLLGVLPQSPNWQAAFDRTRFCVERREKQLAALPSRPQASFGAAVGKLAVR
jgi:hypothetical protein